MEPYIETPFYEHHTWALFARYRNQKCLLELYQWHELSKLQDVNRDQLYTSLVGAAFSLWRAAFLCRTYSTVDDAVKGAEETLRCLIEDNSFSFSREQNNKNWMGGYYVNNALYRLVDVEKRFRSSFPKWAPSIESEPLKSFRDVVSRVIEQPDPAKEPPTKECWDIAQDTLDEFCRILKLLYTT